MSSHFSAAPTTVTADDLRFACTRQAKRLKQSLDISLNRAQDLLAITAYQCVDWIDLQTRLSEPALHSEATVLAQMPSSEHARAYFKQHVVAIGRAIGNRMLSNRNLAGMWEALHFVFEGKEAEASLTDVINGIPELRWFSTGIGPDPYAVIETRIIINGKPIRILGTRVYMPQYMDFGDDLNESAFIAAHFGEPLEIIWESPEDWHAAARAYLAAPEDVEVELRLPNCARDAAMQCHEAWFKDVLSYWRRHTEYGGEDETQFLPLNTPHGSYLCFGVPTTAPDIAGLTPPSVVLPSDKTDDLRPLLHIEGAPFCVEWNDETTNLEVAPENEVDAFIESRNPLLDMHDYDHAACTPSGKRAIYVRPASWWDVRYFLRLEIKAPPGKHAYVIKTNHLPITREVLQKIDRRDLTTYTTAHGHTKYVMQLDITSYGDCRSLHLAVYRVGETYFGDSHLVETNVGYTDADGRRQIILELRPEIFALTKRFGKDALLEAAKDGHVILRDTEVDIHLTHQPDWSRKLGPTPPDVVAEIEERFSGAGLTSFNLWSHVKRIQYRRDNF